KLVPMEPTPGDTSRNSVSSALGQKRGRWSSRCGGPCPLFSESGQTKTRLSTSALCQKQTLPYYPSPWRGTPRCGPGDQASKPAKWPCVFWPAPSRPVAASRCACRFRHPRSARRGGVASEPEALLAVLKNLAYHGVPRKGASAYLPASSTMQMLVSLT